MQTPFLQTSKHYKHIRSVLKTLAIGFTIMVSISISLMTLEGFIRLYDSVSSIRNMQISVFNMNKKESEYDRMIHDKNIQNDTFNIYYFGESTMKGEPFVNIIPSLVERMLDGKIQKKNIRWVNMADFSINIEETSKRINWAIHNRDTHISLVVIYAGHNEYLNYHNCCGFNLSEIYNPAVRSIIDKSRLAGFIAGILKLYRLEIDERKFFDVPIFHKSKYADVITNFDYKMTEITKMLYRQNIPVIISTAVGNYADFDPNRSIYTGLENQKNQFLRLMESGKSFEDLHNLPEAITNYEKAASISNTFAETYYRLGKTYNAVGRDEAARTAFFHASDYDGMPIRATSEINSNLKKLASGEDVVVVDTVSYFQSQSPNGLIGYNLMNDGHHPNLEGYRLIAELLAQKICQIFPETSYHEVTTEDTVKIYQGSDEAITGMLLSRAEWLIKLASWRYDPRERLMKAEEYIDRSLTIRKDDPFAYILKMLIYAIKKQTLLAENTYSIAKKIDPKITTQYVDNYWMQQILKRAGLQW